jgi:hypothetical protein
MTDTKSPRELITSFYPLEGAVGPLVELARINPQILQEVIELAMVLGIYAEQRRQDSPSTTLFAPRYMSAAVGLSAAAVKDVMR